VFQAMDGIGSGPARSYHVPAHVCTIATLALLLTGCMETASVLNETQSDLLVIAPVRRGHGPSAEEWGTFSAAPTFARESSSSVNELARESPSSEINSDEYWAAVADFDLIASRGAATTGQEIRFVDAISLLSAGDRDRAKSAFNETAWQGEDLNVAAASQIMLAATLMYEHRWAELRDLGGNRQIGAATRQNIAGMERWGIAFVGLDSQVTTFPDDQVALPLGITPVSTPTVLVRINGREYHFWLDTGSTITVVSSDVAKSTGISPLTNDVFAIATFGGVAPARPVVVKRIAIGGIVLTNTPAIVIDAELMKVKATADGVPWSGLPVDGIIGWDTIRQFDLAMDYEAGRLTIKRPLNLGTRGTASQNLTWVGRPLVKVSTKAGSTLHFTIDTGAQVSFLNSSAVKKAGVVPTASNARPYGIARNGGQASQAISSLRLGVAGTSLLLRGLIVYNPASSGIIHCDGILGSDIAQFGVVRIDATNGLFSVGG
jgi:clan AA aspartic protease (TIGR02281 family)